jgi:hypothetical protein
MNRATSPIMAVLLAGVLTGIVPGRVRTDPEGFSINLPVGYDRLAGIMHDVCTDGIIHGSFEYEQEKVIGGASDAQESQAFPPWKGAGAICYKIRAQTIAPAHFVASNDIGTISIRYIVVPVDQGHTHISIDAVFIEDSHRRRHASSGIVETAEFREIAKELKALTDAENRQQQDTARRERQASREAGEAKERELKATLASLNQQLQEASTTLQELQRQVEVLSRGVYARIQAPAAELKTSPLALAGTVELLQNGQRVTVLQRILYWDRVRTPDGSEGWVYSPFVEALP